MGYDLAELNDALPARHRNDRPSNTTVFKARQDTVDQHHTGLCFINEAKSASGIILAWTTSQHSDGGSVAQWPDALFVRCGTVANQ